MRPRRSPPPIPEPVAGVVPNGAACWFNGQPGLVRRPPSACSRGQHGGQRHEAPRLGHVPGGGPAARLRRLVPEEGQLPFDCTIHPGMDGTVKVVGKRAKVPSKAKLKRTVTKRQGNATVQVGEAARRGGPDRERRAGRQRRRRGREPRVLPRRAAVTAGSAVRVRAAADSTEIHNVVFGPGGVRHGARRGPSSCRDRRASSSARSPSTRPTRRDPRSPRRRQRLRQHGPPGHRAAHALPALRVGDVLDARQLPVHLHGAPS